MNIAQTLRRLRERSNLTQVEVARRAGITQGTYSAYELGTSCPKIKTLSRLADIFGVSVAAIDPSLLTVNNADPFMSVITAAWSRLTLEERAKLAVLAQKMIDEKNQPPATVDGAGAKLG